MTSLIAFIRALLEREAFPPGEQQAAAECFMRIVEHAKRQGVQRRYCCAKQETQVSRLAAPVSMGTLLQTLLRNEDGSEQITRTVVVRR